jgi:hypothetical protein
MSLKQTETSGTLRNKMGKYLKSKINELETNSKNRNIRNIKRGINEFKKGYQPRSNLVKEENVDLHADSQNIFNRWKNCFIQLFNLHGVSDIRQTQIHTAELFVPEPSSFKVEISIEKLKRY